MPKPAQKKPREPMAEPPDVERHDEIYFRHTRGPMTGRVLARGAHGCTVAVGDKQAKVYWEDYLGHKVRVQPKVDVVSRGEDGFLVANNAGHRRFVRDPMGVVEPPAAHKSLLPTVLFIGEGEALLKAAGRDIKNRPGLVLKDTTDKTGKRTKRWMKATDHPPGQHNIGHGHQVKFAAPHGHEEGTVNGHPGEHGVHVDTADGRQHKVLYRRITHHAAPAKDAFPERRHGESDREYATRAVDKMDHPGKLPEDHGKYFETDRAHATVSLDKLESTKSDEENAPASDNAARRMHATAHGKLGRRDPISVRPNKAGGYDVMDGNATLTAARAQGWSSLPVKHAFFAPEEVADLPRAGQQPYTSWEELSSKGEAALGEYRSVLGGVAKAIGLRTDVAKPKLLSEADQASPDGFLFVGGLKGEERSRQKVEADYGGDWSMLRDIVRATISVANVDQIHQVLEAVRGAGLEMAQKPKDRISEPLVTGYRDIMMVVKLPSGMLAELQVSLKPMSVAKTIGHADYETMRNLQAKYDEETPSDDWSSEDHAAYYDAIKRQRDVYGRAWAQATKSAGKS